MKIMRKQTGVALITAMLVVSIASIVAINMAMKQQLDIQRVANLLNRDHARLYAIGAENWAKLILSDDDKTVDHLNENWAVTLKPIEIDGGQITGYINDLQGHFNINNLWDAEQKKLNSLAFQRFQRLLDNLGLETKIATAVVDWLDADINPTYPDGVEELTYLNRKPAYRSADALMVDISELRLIEGVDAVSYALLLPHVTALPQPTNINVNTASDQVLLSLADNIDKNTIENLIKRRKNKSYRELAKFLEDDAFAGVDLNPAGLGINSRHFQLHTKIQVGSGQVHLSSHLQRTDKTIKTIARTEEIF